MLYCLKISVHNDLFEDLLQEIGVELVLDLLLSSDFFIGFTLAIGSVVVVVDISLVSASFDHFGIECRFSFSMPNLESQPLVSHSLLVRHLLG